MRRFQKVVLPQAMRVDGTQDSRIILEGYEDYYFGNKLEEECPYEFNSEQAQMWMYGYNIAEGEFSL